MTESVSFQHQKYFGEEEKKEFVQENEHVDINALGLLYAWRIKKINR